MGANLITLDEYKAFEERQSFKNDEKLEGLITSVSQLVKVYCANSFIDYFDTDKVETFTLDIPIKSIQVSESPLVSVTKVEERLEYSSAYSTLDISAFDYYVDYDTDTIIRTSSAGFRYWAQGPGSVRVTYKAGYAETPSDLKLAIVDLINYYEYDEHKPSKTFGSISISNEPSSTQWRNVGFPDHIKRVLDLHKNVRV